MEQPDFEIFIDGGCPACSREARIMRRLDRGRGRLKITDLGSPEFHEAALGVTYDGAMRSIHGRLADGRVVSGVEVFRQAYAAVGFGWLLAPTKWPLIRTVVDALYRVFAAWRYRRRMAKGCPMPNHPVA